MMILRRWPRAVLTPALMLVVAAFLLWQGISILVSHANAPIWLGWVLVALGLFKGAVWSFVLVGLLRHRDIIDRHLAGASDPDTKERVKRYETIAFRVGAILGLVLAIGGTTLALSTTYRVFLVLAGYGLVMAGVFGVLGVRARRAQSAKL